MVDDLKKLLCVSTMLLTTLKVLLDAGYARHLGASGGFGFIIKRYG
jgi:hypothetical protein